MVSRHLLGPILGAALSITGCVRAPAPLDVTALVRSQGEAGARGALEVRILDAPRDVAARLALAKLADDAQRPTQALAQLEGVLALGGPLGTRWHADDKARFARLIAARGRARLARSSAFALDDLARGRRFGAVITDEELAQARAARAIAQLRHIDPGVRAEGQRTLAALAGAWFADPSWIGADVATTPHTRGAFGAWLWTVGARRAAWEMLHAWRTTTAERDLATNPLHAAYLRAYAWWTPLDGPEPPAADLVGPGRCAFASTACEPDVTGPSAADPDEGTPVVDGAPREVALARFLRARSDGSLDTTALLAAYRRDPGIADRLARDAVAQAIDPAPVHAALGTLFGALGDPARARTHWQAAVDETPDEQFERGLAIAIARAGDPDAALVYATTAAAANGDPATVWIEVSRALEDDGGHSQAIEAARNAIDLAGRDTIEAALAAAAAASRALGRTAQAEAFERRRTRLAAAPSSDITAGAVLAAQRWVVSRSAPRDVAVRAALLGDIALDDPRRAVIIAELVALAGDADPVVGRAALDALP